jgi:hypothetical protein
LEKAARASFAALCGLGANLLRGAVEMHREQLLRIPFFGPIIMALAEGLCRIMETPQLVEKVFNAIRDLIMKFWNWLKRKWQEFVAKVKERREERRRVKEGKEVKLDKKVPVEEII